MRCAFDERCIPLGIQALFAGKRGAHQVVRAEAFVPSQILFAQRCSIETPSERRFTVGRRVSSAHIICRTYGGPCPRGSRSFNH